MSDDLIKRLREADSYNKKYYALDPLHKEAADRIEQLNERLTAATDDAKEAEAYAEQLEAKLTKAVETLRCLEIAATGAGVPHPQERKLLHEQIALTRITLAELEGKE